MIQEDNIISDDNLEEGIDSNELFEHHRIETDPGQKPLRIDKFLVGRLLNSSRNKIQMAASVGNVRVNDKPVKSNYKVKPNEVITLLMSYPKREITIIPQDIPLNITFEDDDFLIVNKEPGMVVHPGYGNYTGTLVNALTHHLRDNDLFSAGEERPGIVHRIDKNTSGLLVVAKNELALNKLASQFFHRTTDRRYWALVWGNIDEDEGTITGYIGRSLKNRKKMDVFPDGEFGKHAVTHYKVLERLGYITLIECKLETGRTHQIRAHFQHFGHPLFNDHEYGGNAILKGTTFTKYKQFVQNCFKELPRQALHARSLSLDHPVTGERMSFDSEMPEDMKTVIRKWHTYLEGRTD